MTGKSWPLYYRDELEVGNPEACISICTLWTPRTLISKWLERGSFAVVGNLYSRDGLNPMTRNILANPTIRYIIVCGESLNDSAEALFAFFEKGVDAEWKIVSNGGLIDREIPLATLNLVRENVSIIDLRGLISTEEIKRVIKSLKPLPPFSEHYIFPTSEPIVEVRPSEKIGFILRESTVAEAWIKLVYYVMTFGRVSPTDYGQGQRELLNVMVDIEVESELEQILPAWMPISHEQIQSYVSSFLSSDQRSHASYVYGSRLLKHFGVNQIERIVSDLQRFRFSRRAVACLWDPECDSKSADPPCIVLLQAQIRDDRLHLTAYVRSHDVFRAWHYNAFALRALQEIINSHIGGTTSGRLTIISNSAHIYEDSWGQAMKLIHDMDKDVIWRQRFEPDPRGSFVIRLEDDKIVVYHYAPEGDKIGRFRGRTARELARQLEPFLSLTSHAIYLGRELQKAEDALKRSVSYVQDGISLEA